MFKNSNRLHLFVRSVFAAVFSLVLVSNSFADITGRAGRSGAPPGGTCAGSCHTVVAGVAIPTLTWGTAGPVSIVAGSTNTYTVTVSGGPGATPVAPAIGAGGIDIATDAGTLVATQAGTKLLSGEVVQSASTPFTAAGTVTYTFDLIAPATNGTVTLYARGFSGNGDLLDSNDGTSAVSMLVITVTGGATTTPTPTPTPGPTTTPTPTPTPMPSPATGGEALYNANCASCHGAGGLGIVGNGPNIVGESAEDIAEAFVEYPADHDGLAALNLDLEAIAVYLAEAAAAQVAAGEKLFIANCESCHGVGGAGDTAPSIVGESAQDIADAFVEYPDDHAGLAALNLDLEAIAAFLDQEEEGIGSGPGGTKTKSHATTKTAVAGSLGGFALLGLGAGLFWAVRRRK